MPGVLHSKTKSEAKKDMSDLGDALAWKTKCRVATSRIRVLEAENERLKGDVVELLEDVFATGASLAIDGAYKGWYSTNCMLTITSAADRLVELGRLERHPDGQGRVQWYRRIKKQEEPQ